MSHRVKKIFGLLGSFLAAASLFYFCNATDQRPLLEQSSINSKGLEKDKSDKVALVALADTPTVSEASGEIGVRAQGPDSSSEIIDDFVRLEAQANAGDRDSQYMLGKLLDVCPLEDDASGQSLADLEDLLHSGIIPANIHARMKSKMHQCSELVKLLGGKSPLVLHEAWIESAAENGSALAQLEIAVFAKREMSIREYETLVYRAFEQSAGNATLELEAIRHAQFYLGEFPDIGKSGATDGGISLQRRGWEYLTCVREESCDMSEYLEYQGKYYRPIEIEEAREYAEKIDQHISARNWEQLGLPLAAKP